MIGFDQIVEITKENPKGLRDLNVTQDFTESNLELKLIPAQRRNLEIGFNASALLFSWTALFLKDDTL